MILYHGTNIHFGEIDLSKSNTNKDFGKGFYLSDTKEQAKEMAAVASIYLPILLGNIQKPALWNQAIKKWKQHLITIRFIAQRQGKAHRLGIGRCQIIGIILKCIAVLIFGQDARLNATQKYNCLFHRSSVLVKGITPTSLPKRFNI